MAALLFPSHDILRMALANGVLPRSLTDRPAVAGRDSKGRPWIEPTQPVMRDAIATLTRLEVRSLLTTGLTATQIGCWAELLPLQPTTPVEAPVLFELPDLMLASIAAACRRLSPAPIQVFLLNDESRRGAIHCHEPPESLLLRTEDPDSPIEAFMEQAPGIWVRRGWRHPLVEHLGKDRTLVLRPPSSVEVRASSVTKQQWEEFALPPADVRLQSSGSTRLDTPVRFTLRPCSRTPRELAWVFPGESADRFREFCAGANERLLRQFEVAHTNQGGVPRAIVRPSPGLRIPPFLPLAADGYYADPRVPGLFVPSRRSLRPALRVREMATLFGTGPERFTWVEAGMHGEAIPFAVPVAAFRPVPSLVEYLPPAESRLKAERPPPDPFALDRFATLCAPVEERFVELDEPLPRERRSTPPSEPVRTDDRPSWFARSVDRLLKQFRRSQQAEEAEAAEPAKPIRPQSCDPPAPPAG